MSPRHIPYRAWLLFIAFAALAMSIVTTRATILDVVMHHIPTVVSMVGFVWLDRRRPLSNMSYTLVFSFVMLHTLGAHFLYSNVPYNDWSKWLFGTSINEMFGWERNHYDRLVHMSFGAFLYVPVMEFARRSLPRAASRWWPPVIAIAVISFVSHLYEIIEWGVSVFMSEETAENYNGQQGDIWDAQKDMAIALFGAALAMCINLAVEAMTGRRIGTERVRL